MKTNCKITFCFKYTFEKNRPKTIFFMKENNQYLIIKGFLTTFHLWIKDRVCFEAFQINSSLVLVFTKYIKKEL